MDKLQKRYGLLTAICMVVGIVIGSGVFFKTHASFSVIVDGEAWIGVNLIGTVFYMPAKWRSEHA